MNLDPLKQAKDRSLLDQEETLEIARAQKLAAMTDEEALQIIKSLRSDSELPRQRSDWSGLVEQQAIFHGLTAKQ